MGADGPAAAKGSPTVGSPPLLIQNPVLQDEEALHLIVEGQPPIRLSSGAAPVRQFNPGWHAELLCTLLDPLWILVLRHEDGDSAVWYVTHDGLLASAPQHRPERQQSQRRLQQVADWLRAAVGVPIRLPMPNAVAAYLALPPEVRRELDLLLDEPLTPTLRDEAALRAAMEGAGPVVFEPIPGTRGYLVGNPGAMVPLRTGDDLAALQPGWSIASIQTEFAPLLAVILRHEDGLQAAWFIDLSGRLVSHHASLLGQPLKEHLAAMAAPLFESLWARFVLGRNEVPIAASEALDALPTGDLSHLVPQYLQGRGEGGETVVWRLDAPPPPGLGYVVPTSRGLRVFEETLVVRALRHALHGEMDRMLRKGRMRWPSPADGRMVESDGFALMFDQHCFAYRFHDEAAGLVFLVVCTGTHFYNYALYFPSADLLVAADAAMAAACRTHFAAGRDSILRHLTIHRGALLAGGAIPRDETIRQFFGGCGIHIGHYVWQDLAGLAYLLRHADADRPLPWLEMFSTGTTHRYFGPEERIFPMFAGRIDRHTEHFDQCVGDFYRRNQRVIKYTAISVPAELRRFMRAAGDATPELEAVREAADAARARPAPVILFGIRVGNRTMQDMDDYALDLLGRIAAAFPGATVILDGLNDDYDAGRSVEGDVAPGSDLAMEFAIGRRLAVAAETLDVNFVDNVNHSALRSTIWCSRADCFIAPLGAALAKYRWLCNTPGLVVSSRWNLEHRKDLHIYDAPAALEGTSEMLFGAIAHVRDLDPERDAGGFDGRGNFVVDRDAIFEQFEGLVRRHLASRAETTNA